MRWFIGGSFPDNIGKKIPPKQQNYFIFIVTLMLIAIGLLVIGIHYI